MTGSALLNVVGRRVTGTHIATRRAPRCRLAIQFFDERGVSGCDGPVFCSKGYMLGVLVMRSVSTAVKLNAGPT